MVGWLKKDMHDLVLFKAVFETFFMLKVKFSALLGFAAVIGIALHRYNAKTRLRLWLALAVGMPRMNGGYRELRRPLTFTDISAASCIMDNRSERQI